MLHFNQQQIGVLHCFCLQMKLVCSQGLIRTLICLEGDFLLSGISGLLPSNTFVSGWDNQEFQRQFSLQCSEKTSSSTVIHSLGQEFRIHVSLASKKSLHTLASYGVILKKIMFSLFFVPSKAYRIKNQDWFLSLCQNYQILTICSAASLTSTS